MRILHITNDYYHSGVYRTLHQGFLREGVDSTFFVPMPVSARQEEAPHVVEAHCFRSYDRYWYMNKQRKIYRRFRETAEREKPELLHGYFLYSAGIHCLWAKREFGIPYLVTVQNTDINVVYRRLPHLRGLGWDVLREAAGVIFVSEAYRSFVLEHMVPAEAREQVKEKSRLIPFALDPFWTAHANLSRRNLHNAPLRLLTVGTVDANKNQLRTAKAAQLLEQQGLPVELSVVGACADRRIDRRLRTYPFVRQIEKLPKERLIEEYRRADLFVLPSLTESFGLVYAEALSQGLPIVYSAGQGFDRQFPEGFVGCHVDARSPEDIAQGIKKVLETHGELQPRCGGAAARFSQEQVCRESIELYRTIVSGG